MSKEVRLYDHISKQFVTINWKHILWCRLEHSYTLVCMYDYKQYRFDKNELAKALAK